MKYRKLKLTREINSLSDLRAAIQKSKDYEHNVKTMTQILQLLYRANRQILNQDSLGLKNNCGIAINGLMRLRHLPNASAAIKALHTVITLLDGTGRLHWNRDVYDLNKYDRVSGELEPLNVPNWSLVEKQINVTLKILAQLDSSLRMTRL